MKSWICVGLLTVIAGCGQTKSSNQGGQLMPTRIGDAEAGSNAGKTQGNWTTVSTRTSLRDHTPVVILDYYSTTPGQVVIASSCFEPLPEDFELGLATCVDDPDLVYPVYAKNVEQYCTVDRDQGQALREPLEHPGCEEVTLRAHLFNPPLTFSHIN